LPVERYPIFPQSPGQGALWWYRYPLSGIGPRTPQFYLVLFLFLWPALLGVARLARSSALRRVVSVLEPLFLVCSLFGTCIFVGAPARGGYLMLAGIVSYGIACVGGARRRRAPVEAVPGPNR
jgi:hypothetical protein